MADIELVIKISEEEYINIKNTINSLIENGIERTSMSKVCLAILDGTPLPKGHWIIDKEKLGYYISKCSACGHIFHGNEILIYRPKYCANCGAYMREGD